MQLRLALVATLLSLFSCGQAHFKGTNCGIAPAGDYDDRFGKSWLTDAKLQHWVDVALDAATFTTDYTLMDPIENCKSMIGFRVYTKNVDSWESYGKPIGGFTSCWSKIVVVNKPLGDTNESMTSLVHELFHVMQKCKARAPIDKGLDEDHANWFRDGIIWAIEETKEY